VTGYFKQVKVHGLRVDVRHEQSSSHVARRTDGSKDISVRVSLIANLARTRSFFGPDANQSAFLSDTGFVLQPDFDDFSFGRLWEDCG
jgi:hypothetical protein